jgi:hypothetical protein
MKNYICDPEVFAGGLIPNSSGIVKFPSSFRQDLLSYSFFYLFGSARQMNAQGKIDKTKASHSPSGISMMTMNGVERREEESPMSPKEGVCYYFKKNRYYLLWKMGAR